MNVIVYTPEEWKEYAEAAHKLVFKEIRDASLDRVNFALVAHDNDRAIGYVTCRESDSESVYWQFGGVLEEYRGILGFKAVRSFLSYCGDRYKRISCLVENDNLNCLTLLMKLGFRIIALRSFKGDILLELYWEV